MYYDFAAAIVTVISQLAVVPEFVTISLASSRRFVTISLPSSRPNAVRSLTLASHTPDSAGATCTVQSHTHRPRLPEVPPLQSKTRRQLGCAVSIQVSRTPASTGAAVLAARACHRSALLVAHRWSSRSAAAPSSASSMCASRSRSRHSSAFCSACLTTCTRRAHRVGVCACASARARERDCERMRME